MSSAKKTDASSHGSDQQSAVRARSASDAELTPVPRDIRIARKVALAQALLEKLPNGDERGRLLHIAVLRRDEALLDGILSSLK